MRISPLHLINVEEYLYIITNNNNSKYRMNYLRIEKGLKDNVVYNLSLKQWLKLYELSKWCFDGGGGWNLET